VGEKKMENEETTSEIDLDEIGQKPKTSRLAVTSLVFGILGPFSAGAMWVASINDFLRLGNPKIIALFSCSAAWILGLILGLQSLKCINKSEGKLAGKEYATVGMTTSVVWMVVVLAALLLPTLFYVNS
jgi:hypothetical protein